MSLQKVYPRRALRAEEWRSAQMLGLLSESSKIMNVAQIDTVCIHFINNLFKFSISFFVQNGL